MRSMRNAAALSAFAAALACKGPGVTAIDADFFVTPLAIDFGRVFQSETAVREVRLASDGQLGFTVKISSDNLAFIAQSTAQVPPAGVITLGVTYLAGQGHQSGTLTLRANNGTVRTVALSGFGVAAQPCVPTNPCMDAKFDRDAGSCVETARPEGAACAPAEICQENGRCTAGTCVGTWRACNDNSVCTVDSCKAGVGCINAPISCPAPSNACHYATCDPSRGCGEAQYGLGTPCGPVNCREANVCDLFGNCFRTDATEGYTCAAALGCQDESKCHNHVCVTPDPKDLVPQWRTRLDYSPSLSPPAILADANAIFIAVCGVQPTIDGGPGCGITSYSTSGFGRYTVWLTDGGVQLVHLTPRGLLTLGDSTLRYLAPHDGLVTEGVPAPPMQGATGIAAQFDGGVLLSDTDGWLSRWATDAGLVSLTTVGASARLAIDNDGTAYAWSAQSHTLTTAREATDGGWTFSSLHLDAGLTSLTVSAGRAVVGRQYSVASLGDGGWDVVPLGYYRPLPNGREDEPHDAGDAGHTSDAGDAGDAGNLGGPSDAGDAVDGGDARDSSEGYADNSLVRFFPRGDIQADGFVYSVGWTCPTPLTACADAERDAWVYASNVRDGTTPWKLLSIGAGISSRVVEFAILTSAFSVGVGGVGVFPIDGGARAGIGVLTNGGNTAFLCLLPPESTDVSAALVSGGSLYTIVGATDAGGTLEMYDLRGIFGVTSGWGTSESFAGTRRAQ